MTRRLGQDAWWAQGARCWRWTAVDGVLAACRGWAGHWWLEREFSPPGERCSCSPPREPFCSSSGSLIRLHANRLCSPRFPCLAAAAAPKVPQPMTPPPHMASGTVAQLLRLYPQPCTLSRLREDKTKKPLGIARCGAQCDPLFLLPLLFSGTRWQKLHIASELSRVATQPW